MSRRLIIRGEAEADIAESALWYNEHEPGLGLQLTAEIRAAILRVVANPFFHLQLRKNPDVRRVLTRGFPYRVFFIVRDDAIVVFAVLHAARHDRHWKRRV